MGQCFVKNEVPWDENERVLWNAAATGDLITVQRLMQSGMDVNCGIKGKLYKVAPLLYALCERHTETVKLIVPNVMKDAKDTLDRDVVPLIVASINGHKDIVKCLLSEGSKGLDKALCCAVHARNVTEHVGYLDIVEKLLNFGANPNSGFIMELPVQNRILRRLDRAPHNKSVLMLAVDNGYLQIAKLLLQRGAEVNYLIPVDPYNCAGRNISWNDSYENERRRRVQILNLLLLYGSDVRRPALKDPQSTFNAYDYAVKVVCSLECLPCHAIVPQDGQTKIGKATKKLQRPSLQVPPIT